MRKRKCFNKCPIIDCDAEIKDKEYFFIHLRTHDLGVKWYYCRYLLCTRRYRSKKGLEHHINSVHDVKWYGCPFCAFSSKHWKNIEEHIKRIHIIELLFPDREMFEYVGIGHLMNEKQDRKN